MKTGTNDFGVLNSRHRGLGRPGHLPAAVLLLLATWVTAGQGKKEYKPDIRKTDQGISYLSTGVGYDSRINLPRFSLQLVFSARTQKYLANIQTEISPGPGGKPVQIQSPGPWLHVDLPPGKYTVKARTAKGHEVSQSFSIVRGRVTRLKLVWDISDEDI